MHPDEPFPSHRGNIPFLHFPARGGWPGSLRGPADLPTWPYQSHLGHSISAPGSTSRHCGMLLLGAAANRHTILAHLTAQSKPPSNHDVRKYRDESLIRWIQ